MQSRIIRIADAYDAMTSMRCYQSTSSHEEAVEEIRLNVGRYFDPHISKIFIENVVPFLDE